MAFSILIRKNTIDSVGEYPSAPNIKNIGVRPDKTDDIMTVANLLDKGKGFVDRFTLAMEDYVREAVVLQIL